MLGAITSHYVASTLTGYPAEVMADSPLMYLRLGDASGTTATDSSGNGRHGTIYGSPTMGASGLITADADTCIDFDGSNDRVDVPYGSWMNAVASFTAEAVIRPDAVFSERVIVGRVDRTLNQAVWMLRMDGNVLQFYVNTNGTGGWNNLGAGTTFSTATKYHVACSYDGTTRRLYVNGSQVNSGTGVTPWTGNIQMGIGSWAGTQLESFDGKIDEVAYYGSALSAGRIAAHAALV